MRYFFSLIIIISIPFFLKAQTPEDDCHKSTEGSDFWFGFMEGRDLEDIHFLEINVSAREATTFTIFYGPDETQLGLPYQITPFNSVKVIIPWDLLEHFGSEKIENKGIHLVSELPVNVFALNWDKNSSDAAVIYPTESLGIEYYAMCYTPSIGGDNGRNTEFLIVATEDSTTVNITPPVVTHKHKPANTTFTIELDKGQSYQVQSMNIDSIGQGDLTGSYITSDKPIALFSGSLISMVPANSGTGDHLFEQMPPVNAWGREFFTIPHRFRYWDRLRILSQEDRTVVWINGLKPDTLDRGEYRDTVLLWYQPKRIIAEKPVLIAQFSQSTSEDLYDFSGGNNEPFMTILSPAAQYRNSGNFVVYESLQPSDYFINLVFPREEISNIYLNNEKLTDLELQDPVAFDIKRPANNFGGNFYAQLKVDPGVYNMWIDTPDKGFFATSYSYGLQESLGYGVAFNLDNLVDLGSSINFQEDTLLLCYGDTIPLDAGSWFNEFYWNTGDTTQSIAVADSGWYWVEVKDVNGCPQSDSVFVFLSHPIADLGLDELKDCEPTVLKLDAGEEFWRYYWSTEERTQTIIVDSTGTYEVTVVNRYGCKASDQMSLTVYPIPKINVVTSSIICDTLVTPLEIELLRTDLSPWDMPLDWNWRTEDPDVSISDSTDTFAKIRVPAFGDYLIYYDAVTQDGCDTIKQIQLSFNETPTSDFTLEGQNDECSDFSKKVLYTGDANPGAFFHWDFGSSLIVDSIDYPLIFRVSLGIGESHEIRLVVEENGCYSDTAINSIVVLQNVDIKANKTHGCDTLTVSFDGEMLLNEVDYSWSFGDDSTSNEPNPVHFYAEPKLYNVGLTITSQSNNECRAKYSFKEMIQVYPTPVAAFTGDQNLCYDDSLKVLYTHAKDSSIYKWYKFNELFYAGFDKQEITVNLNLPFTMVSLVVEEYGCISDPWTKRFSRKPHIDFTIDKTEGCHPLVVQATGNSNDNNILYYWLKNRQTEGFGDTYNFNFNEPGSYDLGVHIYSEQTTCRDTLLLNDVVLVNPTPFADFEVDLPIAYDNNSLITFTNLSELGTKYLWDFGDGNFSQEINPQHNYGEVGIYNAQLINETEFGCTDTASLEINIVPFTILAPNAFRPESEYEINKYFTLVGEGINPEKFNMKIYDRWGQLIFESFNHLSKWDGKSLNGEPAQMGNYIWTASYSDILGFNHELKGQVLLIR
ncbi:MAG: PKD domain-containing protein [Mariniphaga sp.]|nr:PKD domain-containing protein [Mariniphaga sp.]